MRSAIVVALNYGGTQPPGPIARYARGDDYHDGHARTARRTRPLVRGRERRHGAHALVRGHRSRARARPRAPRRTRLVRQEHEPDQSRPRLVLLHRRAVHRRRPRARRARSRPTAAAAARAASTRARRRPSRRRARSTPRAASRTSRSSSRARSRSNSAPAIGELLYGCDICQDVCPWNVRFSRDVTEPALLTARRTARTPTPRNSSSLDDD